MKKKTTALIFLCALSAMVVYYLNDHPEIQSEFKIEIIEKSERYSYHICFGEKLLIKQNHIPALASKKKFCNEEEARKVAELVVEKLSQYQNPSVTLQELQDLKINLHCE